jgi:hypothetical protein
VGIRLLLAAATERALPLQQGVALVGEYEQDADDKDPHYIELLDRRDTPGATEIISEDQQQNTRPQRLQSRDGSTVGEELIQHVEAELTGKGQAWLLRDGVAPPMCGWRRR